MLPDRSAVAPDTVSMCEQFQRDNIVNLHEIVW